MAAPTVVPTRSMNAHWQVTSGGGLTFTTYEATFTFSAGDLDSTMNTEATVIGQRDAAWTYPTVGTRTATSVQVTGLTTIVTPSSFQAGNLVDAPLPTGGSGGSGEVAVVVAAAQEPPRTARPRRSPAWVPLR